MMQGSSESFVYTNVSGKPKIFRPTGSHLVNLLVAEIWMHLCIPLLYKVKRHRRNESIFCPLHQ